MNKETSLSASKGIRTKKEYIITKSDNVRLEILDGKTVSDEFLNDLEVFFSFKTDIQKDIISKTFSWYPERNIEEEWEKWLDKRPDKEKERLKSAIKIILFIMREGIVKRFSDNQFSQELKKIQFKPNLIKFFLKELNENKEKLVNEIEKIDVSVIPKLSDLSWRIDVKKTSKYSKKIDESCVIFRMSLSGAKTEEVVFELSNDELNSLMRSFSIIKKEIELLE